MPTTAEIQARIDRAVRACRDAAMALTDAELVLALCRLELSGALQAAKALSDLRDAIEVEAQHVAA